MSCARHACLAVPCSQDLLKNACTRELGISSLFHHEAPASSIQDAALCNSDRNNPPLPCVSKLLDLLESHRTAHQALFQQPLASAGDARRKDKSPKLPAGLLSIIGGNTATALTFAVSRERYASRMGQQQPGLSALQTSQSLLESLLVGLAATILLLILEVSLRCLIGGL